MLQELIDKTFANPGIFVVIRRILDNNFKKVKNCIGKELNLCGSTLDIACGTGDFCILFDKSKYLGVDISERYINYAKRKYNDYRFEVMDATKIKLKPGFDNILICGVLHHLDKESMLKILDSAKKVLKKDGRVLILEDIPSNKRFNPIGKIIKKFDTGKHIRTPEEYGRIYKESFKIIRSYTIISGVADYSVYVLKK